MCIASFSLSCVGSLPNYDDDDDDDDDNDDDDKGGGGVLPGHGHD